MGRKSKPSPPGAEPGASASAPAAETRENRPVSTTVDLITFSPTQPVVGGRPAARTDHAAITRRKITRWIAGLLALACVGLVALYLGPKLYHRFKISRAIRLALQGEELIRKKRVEDAVPYVRSAYMLSPTAPEVLRAMARLLTAYRSPEATNYWHWLLQTPDATDDDRRAAAECAMRYDLYNRATTLIQDLLARQGGDARNELLAARWSAARGTPPQTMLYATRAVNDDPANQAAAIFLALHELDNPYLHQDGINRLFHLADNNDASGLEGMYYLVLDPNLKPAEMDRLIARLQSHPLAGELEHIAALNLKIKRHPDQRETLLDQAVAAHQNATPDDLATFCEWLDNHHEAPRVLKLIPREKALTSKSLCFAYLDGLAELKRWGDIKNLLSGATVPIEIPLVELYLSRCADEMGDDRGSDLHWQIAVSAAAGNPAQSFHLATYAEKHGQDERAAAVYRALTQQDPDYARVAYLGLMRVFRDKDFRTQCDLLDQIVARWPHEPETASQDILLNLLLNQHVPEMRQRAVSLLADDSYNLSFRTNVALACLRLNDPAGALQAYNHAVIDWNTVAVVNLVVYAAALQANGYAKKASRLLLSVKRRDLRPELRALIKSIP